MRALHCCWQLPSPMHSLKDAPFSFRHSSGLLRVLQPFSRSSPGPWFWRLVLQLMMQLRRFCFFFAAVPYKGETIFPTYH